MRTRLLIVTIILFALLLAACIMETKPASHVAIEEKELSVGTLLLANGSPANNAKVRIFSVNHIPDSLPLTKSSAMVFSTRTDVQGHYTVDTLPRGEYNILGELDDVYSYQDSAFLSPNMDFIPTGTLDQPGSISGFVCLQPQEDPRTVIVQVLGTNNFAIVDKTGKFLLSNLAQGEYRLRLRTTLPDYIPLFTSIKIRTGKKDSLKDSLWLPFTGIPVVTGLKATYDTVRSIVYLSWKPVDYRNHLNYLVFRDIPLTPELSTKAIAITGDSTYADSLLKPSSNGIFTTKDSVDRILEYRIKDRNQLDKVGPAYKSLMVKAAHPLQVNTTIKINLKSVVWDALHQVDSTVVVAKVNNPTFRSKETSWEVGSKVATKFTHGLRQGINETDSLTFGWGKEGPYSVYFQVRDGFGREWEDSIRIPGNQGPTITGTPLKQIKGFVEYVFAPTAKDLDTNDHLKFFISNLPQWAKFDSSKGILSGIPRNEQIGIYSGILIQVNDGRRRALLPVFDIQVDLNDHERKNNMPLDLSGLTSPSTATLGGKIYSLGGHNDGNTGRSKAVYEYDPIADKWMEKSPLQVGLTNPKAYVIDNKLYVMQGNVIESYNPASEISEIAPSCPRVGLKTSAIGATNNKLYTIQLHEDGESLFPGIGKIEEYDPASKTWKALGAIPQTFFNKLKDNFFAPSMSAFIKSFSDIKTVSYNGKLYLFGIGQGSDYVFIYDPSTNTWAQGKPQPRPRHGQVPCALGSKVHLAGGWYDESSNFLDEYDMATDSWKVRGALIQGKTDLSCSDADGKLYFLYGFTTPSGSLSNVVDEYAPKNDE